MKILVITDSLGLPRELPEKVEYNETWVNMLKKNCEVHQLSIGGGVLKDFLKQSAYLNLFLPDLVILQIGIVDCAPRALTQFENDFINRFAVTRKLANKYLPKYLNFLRRKRQVSYTSIADFEKGLKLIKETFNCKVISIGIVPPSKAYEKNLLGIEKKVILYNNSLKKVFENEYIDISSIEGDMVMTDNIHLNKRGHEYIYQIINKNSCFEK